MPQQTKIEIVNNGFYGAYEPLIWTVNTINTSVTFTFTLLGKTSTKRVIARDGVCVLSLASVMDRLKVNEYEFKPFSAYGIGAFEALKISYVESLITYNITINVNNALTSASNALLSKDFISPQKIFYYDNRFECGAFFAGVVSLIYTTDRGLVTERVGVQNDISFQSFRDIEISLADEVVKVNGRGIGVNEITQITGFEDGVLNTAIFYGSSVQVSINAQGNVLSFSDNGVLTSIHLPDGEAISFAGLTADFPIAISSFGNTYFVTNATSYTETSDNSLFLEQKYGCTKLNTGEIFVYNALKQPQI